MAKVYIRIPDKSQIDYDGIFRIRIIYPNGDVEYTSAHKDASWATPCWYKPRPSLDLIIKDMKEYDKKLGYKTLYIGEF